MFRPNQYLLTSSALRARRSEIGRGVFLAPCAPSFAICAKNIVAVPRNLLTVRTRDGVMKVVLVTGIDVGVKWRDVGVRLAP